MNTHFAALDKEAQEYAGRIVGNDEDSNYAEWFNIYKTKFAELIVKECVERLRKEMDQYDLMPGREVSAQTMETAQVLIKNHFGVK